MAGRNIRPFRFNPRSVTDALDGGQVQPGSMYAATNLIFDPSNPFTLECRPAAIIETDFDDFDTPDDVSAAYVVGDICYGMIASEDVSGHDYPFAYDLANNSFVTVSGTIDTDTTPATQSSSGEWTPPTMALVGIKLYVTHPGFAGGMGAFFGWFDVTDPTTPVWHAGNTAVNALPSVPTSVSQFNNRAWFSCGSALYFTDALETTITDATQILTVGDSTPITAQCPIPLTTSVQGIIQSLAVFKGEYIALITGDTTEGNLALNIISSSVGCNSPRTIAIIPGGAIFRAIDGIRIITGQGVLQDPNTDLKNPFIFTLSPSRASAGYNNNIYRITVTNGHISGSPVEEYWYDFRNQGWTGPHTFTQTLSVPYADSFVCFNTETAPAMYISAVVQSLSSTFIEDGADLTFDLITSPMADDGGLYENSVVLSTVSLQIPGNATTYNFTAIDVAEGQLDSVSLTSANNRYYWGNFNWGPGSIWTARAYGLDDYNIPWTKPLVFSRLIFEVDGPSSAQFKVGKLTVGYQQLKYVRVL